MKILACEITSYHIEGVVFIQVQFCWVKWILQYLMIRIFATAFFSSKFNSLENRKIIKLNTHKCFFKMWSMCFFFCCDTTKNFKKSPKIQSKFDYICNIIDVYLKKSLKVHVKPSCIFQVKIWISEFNSKQVEIYM